MERVKFNPESGFSALSVIAELSLGELVGRRYAKRTSAIFSAITRRNVLKSLAASLAGLRWLRPEKHRSSHR